MKLTFLGATNTVTGSRFLLEIGERKLLIDCGLFQGYKYLRQRNWDAFPVDPQAIDAIVLTHAHLDHSGYVPLLVRQGYTGPVYCTSGTADLCELLWPDSGHLQEEEAAFLNRIGASKHKPALPLYTRQDAVEALAFLKPQDFEQALRIDDISITFLRSGHLLGASLVCVEAGGKRIVFTGDVGRPHDVLMKPPVSVPPCDYLVLESTYGDRLHEAGDPRAQLKALIARVSERGGVLLIPSFAVGRAQAMIYLLVDLMEKGEVGELPIYLDSPMAIDASRMFCRYDGEHRLSHRACDRVFARVKYVRDVEDSIALAEVRYPHVIISASGMATGGRVLHHLKRLLPGPENVVLFVGYQAGGTRGARLVNGEQDVRIHGREVRVRADVAVLDGLSAHADYRELLDWLSKSQGVAPKTCFLVHGEESAIDGLRWRIGHTFGWHTEVPCMGQSFTL